MIPFFSNENKNQCDDLDSPLASPLFFMPASIMVSIKKLSCNILKLLQLTQGEKYSHN